MTDYPTARILNVQEETDGTELNQGAAANDTMLHVYSAEDFSADGGQLILNDVVYDYLTVDYDEATITLSSGLMSPAVEDDDVMVYPISSEVVALVQVDEGEDAITARIPYSLRAAVEQIVRDDVDEEIALLRWEDSDDPDEEGEWVIHDLLSTQYKLLGGAIFDPSEPPPSDGVPPPESPTPVVESLGFSGLLIKWAPVINNDQVRYRVYLDSVNPPVQLHDDTAGALSAASTLPDGTPLDPAQVYFVQIEAYDEDGAAAKGGVAQGSPVVIPANAVHEDILVANEFFSRTGYFGQISADQITTSDLTAVLAILGGLIVGSNIRINPDEGIVISGPMGDTILRGNLVDIKGEATLAALTVLGNLAIRGSNNEVSKNSSITLETGTTAPKSGPTITPAYQTKTKHGGYGSRGFAYHANQNRWFHVDSLFGAGLIGMFKDGNGDFVWALSWGLNASDGGNRGEILGGEGGVAIDGDKFYVLCRTNEEWEGRPYTNRWYVYQFNFNPGQTGSAMFTFVRRWRYLTSGETTTLSSLSQFRPQIAVDTDMAEGSRDVMIIQSENGGDLYLSRYDNLGNRAATARMLDSNGTSTMNVSKDAVALFKTAADTGTTMWWVAFRGNRTAFPFNNSRIRQTAWEFPLPTANNGGLAWDGTRFINYSHNDDTLESVLYNMSKIKDSDVSTNPINAVQTWRLANATGPAYAAGETAMSPRSQSADFPRRAWLKLSSPSDIPNDTNDPTDPDSVSFYVARGTGTPARTSYVRVFPVGGSQLGVEETPLLDELPVSGDAPPAATSGFGGGTPAELRSAASDTSGAMISLKGDGSGRVGPLSWGANGQVLKAPGGRFTKGTLTVTPNASGVIAIPHGLGVTPSCVQLTAASHLGNATFFLWDGGSTNDTNIFAYVRDHANAVVTASRTVAWVAYE